MSEYGHTAIIAIKKCLQQQTNTKLIRLERVKLQKDQVESGLA